jgi:hemoglobin
MRSLYERIGGAETIAAVVEDFYDRLTHDPRVLHHFDERRMPSLKIAQCAWLTSTLGGDPSAPRADLAEAHKHLDITDAQVAAVVGHLDAAFGGAGLDDDLRRQVMAVISRLWFARVF